MVITTYFNSKLVYANNIKILCQEESIMGYPEWKDRTDSFNKVDVRGIQGSGKLCKVKLPVDFKMANAIITSVSHN